MAPTPYIQYESMDSVKSIFKHLRAPNSQVEDLITRAMTQKRDNCLLESAFPAHIHKHCHFLRPSEELLTVLVDSSVLATQIKYAEKDIIFKINKLNGFRGILHLTVKVAPELLRKPPEKENSITRPIPGSKSGSNLLAALAESVRDDELAIALEKLASHLSKKP